MAKKVKKLKRKELLKEDEFLTGSKQFFSVIYTNRKLIFLGIGGLFAVLILIMVFGSVMRSGEKKADNQFAMALKDFRQVVARDEAPGQDPEAKPEDLSQAYRDSAKKFEEVATLYSGKKAGILARYYAANAYFSANDFESSAKWYGQYLDKVGDNRKGAFVNLAYEGLGYAQEMNGKLDEALAAYQKLIEPENKAFRERGLFNAARIYQVKKEDNKALELYKSLIEDYPDSLLAPQIKKVIAQLEAGV